jgi:hypothetical protein
MRASWCLGLAIAAIPAVAQARPQCPERPWFSGPAVDPGSGLELTSTEVVVHCDGSRARMRCRVDATYVVTNPTAVAIAVPAVVHAGNGVRQTVRLDGHTPFGSAPPGLDHRGSELARRDAESGIGTSFLLRVAPGASATIDVHSEEFRGRKGCTSAPVLEHRHRVVSRNLAPTVELEDHGTDGLPSADPTSQTGRLRVPEHWRVSGRRLHRDRAAGRGWWIEDAPWLGWSVTRRPPIGWGGPFVGIGVAGDAQRSEPRLRAGWELGIGRRFITALAVESDAKRHVDVVPTLELVPRAWHDDLAFLPAPALGMGAVVRAWPEPRAGIRTQLAAHWRFVGLAVTFDAFPRMRDEAARFMGGGMLQVGF